MNNLSLQQLANNIYNSRMAQTMRALYNQGYQPGVDLIPYRDINVMQFLSNPNNTLNMGELFTPARRITPTNSTGSSL